MSITCRPDRMVKAADRGVRVRLLVDDMDLGGKDIGAAVLDIHPNFEVRLFNPFSRSANRMLQMVTRSRCPIRSMTIGIATSRIRRPPCWAGDRPPKKSEANARDWMTSSPPKTIPPF